MHDAEHGMDHSEDLSGLSISLTLTGTGTSTGVPMIACNCAVCTSPDPRDNRMRSGVYVRNGEAGFLIDTGPELRQQMIRARVTSIAGVIYTHAHADHIMGLDDLRIFCFRQKQSIPLYCEPATEKALRSTFAYAFDERETLHSRPRLNFVPISETPFSLCGLTVQPIRLLHGHLPVLGFRVRNVAFCTDVSQIPEASWPFLQNLDVLILGAIRDEPHPTHFNLEQALEVIDRCKPRQAYLTHISHSLPHEATNARLPDHVRLAYDGLTLSLE